MLWGSSRAVQGVLQVSWSAADASPRTLEGRSIWDNSSLSCHLTAAVWEIPNESPIHLQNWEWQKYNGCCFQSPNDGTTASAAVGTERAGTCWSWDYNLSSDYLSQPFGAFWYSTLDSMLTFVWEKSRKKWTFYYPSGSFVMLFTASQRIQITDEVNDVKSENYFLCSCKTR